MDFGFNEEQEQLRAQVRRFVETECPLDRVRQVMEAEAPYDAELWRKMSELGWQALVVPEEHGGLGLKWEDLVVVAEEMGRGLFPSPFIANALATRAIVALGDDAQKARWLPAIASGRLVTTLALLEESDLLDERGIETTAEPDGGEAVLSGVKMFVPYGQAAGLLLVAAREAGGVSLYGVAADAPGVTIEPLVLVDGTQRAARVELDGVAVAAGDRLGIAGGVWPALETIVDAGTVALAAEMVGAADAAVALATDYAKVRKQFGQAIGRFQGIKHKLAEHLVRVESARSLVYYASWAVDNTEDARRNVSMAKASASEALDGAGEDCIHVHGAIGYTWECDAHLYYKRGRYCRNLLGSPDYHRERVLTSQGL
jgi:alkylation response protein AidB-like acyl-CoA dehydrogenase